MSVAREKKRASRQAAKIAKESMKLSPPRMQSTRRRTEEGKGPQTEIKLALLSNLCGLSEHSERARGKACASGKDAKKQRTAEGGKN